MVCPFKTVNRIGKSGILGLTAGCCVLMEFACCWHGGPSAERDGRKQQPVLRKNRKGQTLAQTAGWSAGTLNVGWRWEALLSASITFGVWRHRVVPDITEGLRPCADQGMAAGAAPRGWSVTRIPRAFGGPHARRNCHQVAFPGTLAGQT